LILAAFLLAYHAIDSRRQRMTFQNPVAFAFFKGALYVVEKKENTVIELERFIASEPMVARGSFKIEPDEEGFYFMVRKVFPGPKGLVTLSYIYRQGSQEFLGYRFSQYSSFQASPTPLLTIFLEYPNEFPEVSYAFDEAGNHYFGNNCKGHYNIWKVPAAGGIIITGGQIPAEVWEVGERNQALDKWEDIAIAPDGRIYLTSGATGRVVEYSPDGERLREIGAVGFANRELLAPGDVFFAHLYPGEHDCLTVASRGNRSWVQFDEGGKPLRSISPLRMGYGEYDVLVGAFYNSDPGNNKISFDLANKALILFDGDGCGSSNSYIAYEWPRTGLLLALSVLILLFGLFLSRIVSWVAPIRLPFFVKMLILFIPLLILSAYIVGESVKVMLKHGVGMEMVRRSANLASAVINSLSLADLEHIQRPEDREGPVYERVQQTIARIVDTRTVEQTPKWILHKIRDGRYYFGINIWKGPIYQPFVVPSDRLMFHRVLTEKTCQNGRFTDDQGEWFSYVCPILNAMGDPIYVLELYRPTEQLDRALRSASNQVLMIIGATVFAAVLLVFAFSFIFTRPLRKLIKKTALISKGDFEQQVEVRSRDELGDLARAFDRMVVDLKSYVAQLAKTTAEKEAIQSELRLAHEMQQEILPKVFPPLSNADNIAIYAQMEPAKEVGGDFYDFFPVDDDHMGVVVGDVTGKGVPAGLFMMRVRAMLRSSAVGILSAAEALARINLVIAQENPSATFATMFYFVCNIRTGSVTFCNAGHNPPVWLKDGEATFLSSPPDVGRGLPVGVSEDGSFTDGTLNLGVGECLVVYTDGVTEATSAHEEMFGEERLRKVLQANIVLEPRDLCQKVLAEVNAYQADAEQFDDIAILIFKYGVQGA
jgi:serine phosphatase RsbU (regulator of sigma subunit)